MRLVVGISGASGAALGIALLEELSRCGVETHLVITSWGGRTIEHETSFSVGQVREMASVSYGKADLAAGISSGSYQSDGMVIAPCSGKTLASIALGFEHDLMTRAAGVMLKEKRRLVLMVRESPLSEVHLKNMLEVARMGVVIMPPVPAFYNHPQSIADIQRHIVARCLDQFGLDSATACRWNGQLRIRSEK